MVRGRDFELWDAAAFAHRGARVRLGHVVEEVGTLGDGRCAVDEEHELLVAGVAELKIVPGWTTTALPRSSTWRSGGSPRSTVSVPSSTTKTSSCALSACRFPRAPGGE